MVVVGAGHAGGTFAALLCQAGFAGELVVFGDEPEPPYHRPPLSKEFLHGPLEKWLREPAFYPEQGVALRLGETVVGIDRAAGTVTSTTGRVWSYDHLVLATGAASRALPVPGADLDGVGMLRTLADARALRSRVLGAGSVAVVGGGYIGLEVAAVVRANGTPATIVEREERLLARVASPELSSVLSRYHAERGTAVMTGSVVRGFEGEAGRLRAVVVAGPGGDERRLRCDAAVVGVGAVPRDELARSVGLSCDNGIVVDGWARTDDARILAIGDVTSRPVRGVAGRMRLESIPSAVEQAKQAVASVLGGPAVESEVPWFWSDQFDLKLKIAGVLHGGFETVVRGDPGAGRFSLFHHRDTELVAVETANAPADFMAGRRLLAAGRPVDPGRLADPQVGLRDLVTA
ncbi:FAD-dependent oxidoreductase [Frankia sp. CH37]|nr:FAD-dependent oxidoreductase [Parafrankia sp. CH37]